MSFFKDVALTMGISGDYSIICSSNALYIEGVKRVLSLSGTRMRFACGKKVIAVLGNDMTVAELGGGCVGIKGRIGAFEEEGFTREE